MSKTTSVPRILAFAGSTRGDSFNKKLVAIAANSVRDAGGDVTLVDLKDYPMPLYDGDLESLSGPPENAEKLYAMFKSHDALLIASPEYNSSITGVLKNTIDWVSRPRKGDGSLAAFTGKTAALLSASPGKLGGMRGLAHVRSILSSIGVLVLPDQLAISAAHEAFTKDGALKDESQSKRVAEIARKLVTTTRALSVAGE